MNKRIVWSSLAASLLVLSIEACSKKRSPWPDEKPDVNTMKLTEQGLEASPALAQSAKVEADKLVFPLEHATEIQARFAEGKVVISAPSTQPGTTNPMGFLRKVVGVRVEADGVYVDTAPAQLQEVINGELRMTSALDDNANFELPPGVDPEKYFKPFPSGPAEPLPDSLEALGYLPNPDETPARDEGKGVSISVPWLQQPASVDKTGPTFETPSITLAARVGLERPLAFIRDDGKPALPAMVYRGGITFAPSLSFTPRARLEINTAWCPFCELDYFQLQVGGSIKLAIKLGLDLLVAPKPADVKGYTGNELRRLDEAVDLQPVQIVLPDIPIGKPKEKLLGTIYGVPIVLRTGVYADCQGKFRGSFKADAELSFSNDNLALGVEYSKRSGDKKKNWHGVEGSRFIGKASGSVSNADGSLDIECSLTLKTAILAADLAGPYVGIKNTLVTEGTVVNDTCAPDAPARTPATAQAQLSLKAYTAVEVGAEITLLDIITIGAGPFTVASWRYKEDGFETVPAPPAVQAFLGVSTVQVARWAPIWASEKKKFNAGFDCPSQCNDGIKNNAETDLDCGGNCGATCSKAQVCVKNEDCVSRTCVGGSCRGGLSDDEITNQGETDVDCGGPSNPTRCLIGRSCTKTADCGEGFCSKASAPPRICTNDLCLDGVKSGAEGDVDCGGGCASRCATGQACNDGSDCASGACSIGGLCVEAPPGQPNTCVDGLLNGGESGVDCGGLCAQKCAVGQRCRGAGDCSSAVCGLYGTCAGSLCEDSFANGGESDVDCGGSCPNRCGLGAWCNNASDCGSGAPVCHPRTHRCAPPGCDDGTKNGDESSADCGGATCNKCLKSKTCNGDSDCFSNVCV